TGLNFPLVEEAIGPDGQIVGVDLTDAMLVQAQDRIETNGWRNISLVQADAADFEFPTDVDAILSTYALSQVPECAEVIAHGAGKPGAAASVMGRMEASAQPLRAPRSGRVMRAVQAGPLAGLIAQALLLAVPGATVGLSVTGWAIGLICGVTMNVALARGLSRHGSNRLRAADWVTLARASLATGVAALVADSFAHRAPVTLLVSISALALA